MRFRLTINVLLLLVINIISVYSVKLKNNSIITNGLRKGVRLDDSLFASTTSKPKIYKINKAKTSNIVPPKPQKKPKIISLESVQEWAKRISDELYNIEKRVVRRDVLLKSFSDIKIEARNGSAIVERMARDLEQLLTDRAEAAENIMRKAENVAEDFLHPEEPVPKEYTFDSSVDIDIMKPVQELEINQLPPNCKSKKKVILQYSKHFNGHISLDKSSVRVAEEVFDCDSRVVPHLYWSENLLPIFKENYARDASISYQYFCSYRGFLRHYPAALWRNMFPLEIPDVNDIYDCRLRPWYVSAGGAPRDVVILLDASGSMNNSTNKAIAEQFILALLSALTDDDYVNVLRFNKTVKSPIKCFADKLVPANHVNSAAMIAELQGFKLHNETNLTIALEHGVRLLQKQHEDPERPPYCQQAIVLLTDNVYDNFSEYLRYLDPEGNIRVFLLWLHDRFGLRDSTHLYGEELSCNRDGYFAELITESDVTEQVMKILQVLERPLVSQRKKRLRVFSDVYAHVEDPRRSETNWKVKEKREQAYRYAELRKDKKSLLSPERRMKDYLYQLSLDKYGHYYEGSDVNFRLQISVSVPVFDHTTSENITIQLMEEMQRNATRTYPVNRLLGVAGVDIPLDDLKLILPFHELGAGGSLFLIDHRGNIVIHENHKPIFDGDIMKPGYRTVDLLEIEQPAVDHPPRHYPREWEEFRNELVLEKKKGQKSMFSKQIFEGGMRALLEVRDYYWRRILDHYTAVVVLPKYNRYHAVPDTVFSQKLAKEAFNALALGGIDFAVHPDWLYCRHIDPYFDEKTKELIHFIRRRKDEADFAMKKLNYNFLPLPPSLVLKTYQCDEKLMASLCKEAIATEPWARDHEETVTVCSLGSTTAFFASESGLVRWQQHYATSEFKAPPEGSVWSRGPSEPFYRRAAALPDTMIVHAPVAPERKYRVSAEKPPPIGGRSQWYTAARTLGNPGNKGIIGVAGYHFYPKHFEDLVNVITNFPCSEEDPDDCIAQCTGEDWTCVVIDEGGWILAGGLESDHEDDDDEEPKRRHLATEYPIAMTALLNSSIFRLHWIHDYQAVCFPWVSVVNSSATTLPSIVKSVWHTFNLMIRSTYNIVFFFSFIVKSITNVVAETEKDKNKRRNHLFKTLAREKYETLFDKRVFVNRTKYATCDRSRPIYVFQRTAASLAALQKHPHLCSWPLVGAEVPKTNLLLLAIYKHCPYTGRPVPDPMANERVEILDDDTTPDDYNQTEESKLACWRSRVPLLGRPPTTACYKHNYSEEKDYRQCGPWIPDKEPADVAGSHAASLMLTLIFIGGIFETQNLRCNA